MTRRPTASGVRLLATVGALLAGVLGACSSSDQPPAAAVSSTPPTTAAPTTSAPTTVAPTTAPAAANPDPVTVEGINVLLAISDSGPCAGDPSDDASTAVMVRVEPTLGRAAVLSFPTDLWVALAGTKRHVRFATAIDPTNPLRLVDTIFQNFTVHTDHYLSMDACGLQAIIDSVDGVPMSFAEPVRDQVSGFSVPEPACRVLDGAAALAYARSRHLETQDAATGAWTLDDAPDNGQIARQQLLMRRLLNHAAQLALGSPGALDDLLSAALTHATFDTRFTVDAIVEVFSALGSIDPAAISTDRIGGTPLQRGDAEVLEPDTTSEAAIAVLDRFRGRAEGAAPAPLGASTDLCTQS